jgi:uncharacterized membrane protein YsdA (DUF1294 family)
MKNSPFRSFVLISLSLAVVMTIFFWWSIGLELFLAWLIAINTTAFLVYGADKSLAESHRTRVPEKVLLLLAMLFGSLGAWFGMKVFHHKTAKGSFQARYWTVVLVQILIVALYFIVIRPNYL